MSPAWPIACLDVAYSSTAAAVACVMIQHWHAKGANRIEVRRFDSPPERYEPGAFYKRELPLLMPIIFRVRRRDPPLGMARSEQELVANDDNGLALMWRIDGVVRDLAVPRLAADDGDAAGR
jgi:hypothetical protein